MAGRNRGWLAALPPAVLAAAAAAAPLRPAEEPPSDFAGRQYIDSAGCVFLREGKLWTARLGRDGGPVCGYPPTPVHGDAAGPPTAFSPPPPPLDGMGRIEAELVAAVTGSLSPGDLVGAPEAGLAPQPRSAEEVAPADLGHVMAVAVAAAPVVAAAAAGGADRPNARLCALLGLRAGKPAHVLGGDPTGGFCGGFMAPALAPRISSVETEAVRAVARAADPGVKAPLRRGAAPAKAGGSDPAALGKPRREAAGGAAAGRGDVPARTAEDLIPAGTRFLQVGLYHDAEAAAVALRRVAGLGLPVARSREGQGGRMVMAGPFASRQAVVRAHDRLTRAGFRGLVPRP